MSFLSKNSLFWEIGRGNTLEGKKRSPPRSSRTRDGRPSFQYLKEVKILGGKSKERGLKEQGGRGKPNSSG